MKQLNTVSRDSAARGTRGATMGLALLLALSLAACGDKEKKPGQMLASVNGVEITALQLNEELTRAGVAPAQQETARKQLLQALIDRQLLQNEAVKEKTDRDPKVVQSIERAKALIIAQAYLQRKVGNVTRATKAEVADYYEQHADQFARRKTLDLRQLVLATKDLTDATKKVIDSTKSLDELAAWLDGQGVKYVRGQLMRSTAELPPELAAKLLSMPKGDRFIVREGERSTVMVIADVRDTPVSLEASAAQIEQFLYNKKAKAASDAEVARLRQGATIEYANKADVPAAAASAAPAAAAAVPTVPAAVEGAAAAAAPAAAAPVSSSQGGEAMARGVAGLK